MLTVLSTLGPHRLDAGRCIVPSRFRCRSFDRRYVVGALSTGRCLPAVAPRVLIMGDEVRSRSSSPDSHFNRFPSHSISTHPLHSPIQLHLRGHAVSLKKLSWPNLHISKAHKSAWILTPVEHKLIAFGKTRVGGRRRTLGSIPRQESAVKMHDLAKVFSVIERSDGRSSCPLSTPTPPARRGGLSDQSMSRHKNGTLVLR